MAQGRQALVVITYHFSKGSAARGCAGFNYDTAAARRHVFQARLLHCRRSLGGQIPLVKSSESPAVYHSTARDDGLKLSRTPVYRLEVPKTERLGNGDTRPEIREHRLGVMKPQKRG